jgi:hypothetical protein
MNEFVSAIDDAVRSMSPRYRRWKRLLHGLSIEPEGLTRPIESPTTSDFIICGCPRSGTSLVCAVLYQPPQLVTVMEPWDGMRLAPAELFRSLREEISRTKSLSRGRLDVRTLIETGTVRWGRDGEFPHQVEVAANYLLGVKWPAFWRYLELLPNTKFVVCVRDPVEVVASFRKTGGRLAKGLEYDIAFNRIMNEELKSETNNSLARRVQLYDYVNTRIIPYLGRPNVQAVRFERWFSEPKMVLSELETFLGVELCADRVKLEAPRRSDIAQEEEAFIRTFCSTAKAMGY